MGVKATDFGSTLIEQRVGFRGDQKFPEMFLPTKQVGAGSFGRIADDKFGYSVAIDDQLAAVGVPFQDYDENGENSKPEAGAVFVYRRTRHSWEFAYKIVAPVEARNSADNFGYSVALKGNTLVVGAPKHAYDIIQTNPKTDSGAIFIFDITSDAATFEAKFTPVVRDEDDNYGVTVAAHTNAVFAGSYKHGRNSKDIADSPEAGAVWAYTKNPETKVWSLTKKIVAGGNERNPSDNFGQSVSAHKNVMAVGVPNYDYVGKGEDYQDGAGAVYVFEWQTDHWRYKSTLIAPDRLAGDNFGASVSVYDKRIAVGAPGKDENTGKVYLYSLSTLGKYTLASTALPTADAMPAGYVPSTSQTLLREAKFGSAVSLVSDTLAVGAPNQRSLKVLSVDNSVTPHTWVGSELPGVGYAYVYSINTANELIEINKITSADRFGSITAPKESGSFGFSLSIGTNIMVVGEPTASKNSQGLDEKNAAGLAHIYVKNGESYEWSTTVEGFYMDRNADDAFATDFDQNERFMVFTAPNQDFDADGNNFVQNAGAAYVWEKINNSWVYRQKLVASDRSALAGFGKKAIVNGDRIFVQAAGSDNAGSVYVFRFENGVFVEKQKIQHADVKPTDLFGSTMISKDSRLFVASETHVMTLSSGLQGAHGAVFSYVLDGATDTFVFDAKIVPTSALVSNSLFGCSLALNDNILVVGARGHNLDSDDALAMDFSGAVFVFAKIAGNWVQINKLTGPSDERLANSLMGYAMSNFGNMLAVGVPKSDYDSSLLKYRSDAGKVLLYTRNGDSWTYTGSITSPNRQAGGLFGAALAMGDNRLVVGAPGEFVSGQSSGWGDGKAYVFEKVYGDWIVTGTLENVETAPGGEKRRFGFSVAMDGDRVIVGEPFNSTNLTGNNPVAGAGAAWVFEKENSAWVMKSKLTADNLAGRQTNSNFGASVDIRGDIAIVGSPFDSTNSAGGAPLATAGSAYLFRRTVSQTGTVSWNAEKKLAGWAQDRNVDDLFGSSIAAYGNFVIIGATGHDYDTNLDNFVNNAGAVFVYEWVDNVLVYRQKLVAHSQADRISNIGFGSTVAINSTHIVVSAPKYSLNASGTNTNRYLGKVWTFKLENGFWVKERTFVQANTNEVNANSGAIQPQFGYSLALGHLVLAIGAPYSFYGDSNVLVDSSGAVDIYRYNVDHWEFEKTIVPSNRESNDCFGESLVLRDNLIVVGGRAGQSSSPAMNDDGLAYVGGAAWVFSYNIPNWTYTHKIVRGAAEMVGTDSFGTSVSVNGSTMVIGAPNHNLGVSGKNAITGAGAAYVFKLVGNVWQFEKRLVASDRQLNAKFGTDVVVKNDLIWVGAPGADTGFGAVYGYRRNINKTNQRRVRRTASFAATGASQSFTVPANTSQVTFYMWGAAGGVSATGADGGNGGFVRVNVDVTPGETLTVNVGTKPAVGGGGGRTELLRGASTLAVAAGGGGASSNAGGNFVGYAGSAGGFQGEDGFVGNEFALAGLGGSQTDGGAARTATGFTSGSAGAFKQGGSAPIDPTAVQVAGGWPNGGAGSVKDGFYAIGGGGDGWFGGSAGAVVNSKDNVSAPGGAGSCYIAPGLDGFSQTIKTEFDDVFVNFSDLGSRPAVDAAGLVVVEWFETYVSEEWEQETKLSPSAPKTTSSGFGATLDFDGATLIVGLPTHTLTSAGINVNNALGRVDVFEFNGFEWEETAKLYPFGDNGSIVLQGYAETLSVSGDYIVVGASRASYDDAGENPLNQAGIAFAYRKNSGVWGEMQRVAPPGNTRNNGDLIGYQLVQYGDWIFVGAPEHDFDANGSGKLLNAGAVMVWKWVDGVLTLQHKIIAPDEVRRPHARFGFAMEMVGDQLIVGAPTRTDISGYTPDYGHAIIVELNEDGIWEGTQILTSPEGANQTNQFGYAIGVSGDTIAIGSPAGKIPSDSTATRNGAVHMFIRDVDGVWNYDQTVLPTIDAGLPGDPFGQSVSLNDDFLVVGAPNHSLDQSGANSAANAGAVRFFQKHNGVWEERQKVVAWGHDLVNGEAAGTTVSAATSIIAVASPKHPYDAKGNNYMVGAGAVYIWRYETNTWVLEQKITAPNRTANAGFGTSLALTESRLAVGAPSLDDNTKPGSAFVFEKTAGDTSLYAWNAGTRLVPTGTNANLAGDQFGFAVAINGENEVLVGAPKHAYDLSGANKLDGAGAAYVFKKTSVWSMVQKLVSSSRHLGVNGVNGRNTNDKFGSSIAASGNSIIVGAPNRAYDSRGQLALGGSGAAIAFARDTESDLYAQVQFLTSRMNTPAAGDRVGSAVSGYGDYFVVGAPSNSYDANEDNYVSGSGSVYVWHWNGTAWDYIQKISASTGSDYGRNIGAAFGSTVKLHGNILIVGAPQTTVGGVANQGIVFVYELVAGVFEEIQVIKEVNDTTSDARFGYAVDFDGTTLVVGAPDSASGRVSFYEFTLGQFVLLNSVVQPTAGATLPRFGMSVSVDGPIAVAGAPTADYAGISAGAAMIMVRDAGIWKFEQVIYNQSPVAESQMRFGYAIAYEGNDLFVGAPEHDYDRLETLKVDAGAVYYFTNESGGWKFKQKITPVGNLYHNSFDRFGTAISVSEGRLAVGSPYYKYNSQNTLLNLNHGAVFVFDKNADGFYYTSARISPDGYGSTAVNEFGLSVLIDENILVVGAPANEFGYSVSDPQLTNAGAIMVYKFVDNEWFFVGKGLPFGKNGRQQNMRFGQRMTLGDDYLAVSAPNYAYDENGDQTDVSGGVWVYKVESLDKISVNLIGGNALIPATTTSVYDSQGFFAGVNVTSGGAGYKSTPDVVFSSDNFAGYAMMTPVGIGEAKLTSFNPNANSPTITVVNDPADTTGSGAQVEVIRALGSLSGVTLTDHGSGYTDVPTILVSPPQSLTLKAILESTTVDSLTLTSAGSGFTSMPLVTIDPPENGTNALAHAVMALDSVVINHTDKSYVGERFAINLDDSNGVVVTETVDSNNNITSIYLDTAGSFAGLLSFNNVPTTRIVSNQTYGAITDNINQLGSYDYGSTGDPATSTDDYGLVSQPVYDEADYMLPDGVISYGRIVYQPTEFYSFGPIHASALTVNASARVKSVVLDDQGSGYRSIPLVTISGSSVVSATATATIAPTGVESVEIVSGGNSILDTTTFTFIGANTSPAQAVPAISQGPITGLNIVNPGANYTRTPSLVFSDSTFIGYTRLAPTTVQSIVVTQADYTLTNRGKLIEIKRIAEPAPRRIDNQNFGTAIAGYGSTIAVGAPTDALTGDNTAIRNTSGSIMVYDVKAVADKNSKISVNGWLNASSALSGVSDEFTVSMWIRNSQKQRALNKGTLLSILNTDSRANFFPAQVTTVSGSFTIPPYVTKINLSAWGAGNSDDSILNRNGGYVYGLLDVTPGDVFDYTIGDGAATGRTIISKNGVVVATVGSGFNFSNVPIAALGVYGQPSLGGGTLPMNITSNNPNPTTQAITISKYGHINSMKDSYGNQLIVGDHTGGFYSPVDASSIQVDGTGRYIKMSKGEFMSYNGAFYAPIAGVTHTKRIYSSDQGYIRYADTVTNTTNTTKTFSGSIILFGDGSNVRALTSVYPANSGAYGYAYRDNDPFYALYMTMITNDTDATSEKPPSVTGQLSFTITLEPFQTKTYLQYFTYASYVGGSIRTPYDTSVLIMNKQASAKMLEGLPVDVIASVVNFKVSTPDNQYATTADNIFTTKIDGGGNSNFAAKYYNGTSGRGTDSGAGNPGQIAIYPIPTNNANKHVLELSNQGRVTVMSNTGNTIAGYVGEIEDEWNNVVYSYNSGTVSVYFNGSHVGSASLTGDIAAGNLLSLGAKFGEEETNSASVNGYIGYMADIAIWNKALSETEVQDIQTMDSSAVASANLKAHWAKN